MDLGPTRSRRQRIAAGLVFLGIFCGFAATARAACTGLTPCFDANALWLPAGHAELVILPDTAVPAVGQPSFGFAAELLHAPVIAHVTSPDVGRDVDVVDYVHDASLSGAITVLPRLELFATLPARIYQNGAGAGGVASQSSPGVASAALRDPRLGAGYSFDELLHTPGLGVRAGLEASFPLGDEHAFAGERSVVLEPSATLGYRYERFTARTELGARLRKSSEYGDVRLGNQGLIALGAGADVLTRGLLFLSLETFALPALGSSRASGASSSLASVTSIPAEWLVAASTTFRPHGEWQLAASFGTGLPLSGETRGGMGASYLGVTSPEWRTVLSLHFAPR